MSVQLGQLSPDGRYVWNGTQWVPSAPPQQMSADGRWVWNGLRWMPNGAVALAVAAHSPAGLLFFRVYCGVVAFIGLGFGTLGMIGLTANGFDPAKFDTTAPILTITTLVFVYALIEGAAVTIAVFLPRERWAWVFSLVAIALGIAGITLVGALPLLIYWLRGEMRRYYGFAS